MALKTIEIPRKGKAVFTRAQLDEITTALDNVKDGMAVVVGEGLDTAVKARARGIAYRKAVKDPKGEKINVHAVLDEEPGTYYAAVSRVES